MRSPGLMCPVVFTTPRYATPEPRLFLFHNHGALQSVPKAINKCAGCSKARELDNRGASDPQAASRAGKFVRLSPAVVTFSPPALLGLP